MLTESIFIPVMDLRAKFDQCESIGKKYADDELFNLGIEIMNRIDKALSAED
jgi:hypothetical protein